MYPVHSLGSPVGLIQQQTDRHICASLGRARKGEEGFMEQYLGNFYRVLDFWNTSNPSNLATIGLTPTLFSPSLLCSRRNGRVFEFCEKKHTIASG